MNSPHKGQWRGVLMFDLRLNKRLSKQWWGWWFATPLFPLRRHCNDRQQSRCYRPSTRIMTTQCAWRFAIFVSIYDNMWQDRKAWRFERHMWMPTMVAEIIINCKLAGQSGYCSFNNYLQTMSRTIVDLDWIHKDSICKITQLSAINIVAQCHIYASRFSVLIFPSAPNMWRWFQCSFPQCHIYGAWQTARSSPVPQIVVARPHLLSPQRPIYVARHGPLSLNVLGGKHQMLPPKYWLFFPITVLNKLSLLK